jgi:hypothetical protein
MAVGNEHDVKHPENKFQNSKLLFAPFITHCFVQIAGVPLGKFYWDLREIPMGTSEHRVLSGKSS